jgi:hypothetical protein
VIFRPSVFVVAASHSKRGSKNVEFLAVRFTWAALPSISL